MRNNLGLCLIGVGAFAATLVVLMITLASSSRWSRGAVPASPPPSSELVDNMMVTPYAAVAHREAVLDFGGRLIQQALAHRRQLGRAQRIGHQAKTMLVEVRAHAPPIGSQRWQFLLR